MGRGAMGLKLLWAWGVVASFAEHTRLHPILDKRPELFSVEAARLRILQKGGRFGVYRTPAS